MKTVVHLLLLSACANLVASIVTAGARKPGQDSASLDKDSAKFLAGKLKGGYPVKLSERCLKERDEFQALMGEVAKKHQEEAKICNQKVTHQQKQIEYHKTSSKTQIKAIRNKCDESKKPGLYMQKYGQYMCKRLKDGFVMKNEKAEKEKARKEWKQICDGKKKLQTIGASKPSNSTMPSMPPHRSPFPHLLNHSTDQIELVINTKPMKMPERKSKCAQSKTVYEELQKNVDSYNKHQVHCVNSVEYHKKELDRVRAKEKKLAEESSGVMLKEVKIRDCVADYVKEQWCNYEKAVAKPKCNCPCMPSPAKMFYDTNCAPMMKTPDKCRPQNIKIKGNDICQKYPPKKKSFLELPQHPEQPACDCAATCRTLAIQ